MPHQKSFATVNLGRRRMLQGATALAAVSALPFSSQAFAQQAGAIADFTTVSQFLTGRSGLSTAFAQALWAAFTKTDAEFPTKISTLAKFISDNHSTASGLAAQLSADASAKSIAGLPQAILSGWYLGVVGNGADAICVTYTEALANQNVADVLRPPSYSFGAYGTWAAKPV